MTLEIIKIAEELVKNSNLQLKEEDYKKVLLPLETYSLNEIQKLNMKEYVLSRNGFSVDLEMSQEQIIILNNFQKKLIDRNLEKRQALYEKVEKLFKEEALKEKNYNEESLFYDVIDVITAIEEKQYSLLKSVLFKNKVFKNKICFLFGFNKQDF